MKKKAKSGIKPLFLVMKMLNTIEVIDIENKQHRVPLCNMVGAVPIYDTEKKAKEAAENGKYQIVAITIKQPEVEK